MPQQLPSKENSLFRQVVKNYETKQYKKGIKAADQVLRKFPKHADTQAMKSLIINSQGKTEEAFALAKEALTNDMKSSICWHVYGLLYRHDKNYEESLKAYKMALRLDPESQNILRDLAILQVQMRDFPGYIQSRTQMLKQKASFRQNWTALALAHHLNGDFAEAEKILTTYEDTLKSPPPRSDVEHSEAVLYKNTIIADSGDTERALKHLETIAKTSLDRTTVMELRAQYLLKLDRKEDAEKAYRALIKRNNEYRPYYESLEKALGLSRTEAVEKGKLIELYESYASKQERLDAARRIPLDFLEGDDFKKAADVYLRRMLNKGVPSTFTNVKALYQNDAKKQAIEALVIGYDATGANSSETNGDTSSKFRQAVIYFLAQHYDYRLSRDLQKATEYVQKALDLEPTSVDFNRTKARITKHIGNTKEASTQMNYAREQDLKDRYINSKCAKYQLRNNENEGALETMSKFTRNETFGGPLGDLHDMQCMWFLTEDGEAYQRRGVLNLALKRYKSIYDIFDVWSDDQYDFHTFSLRKGQIRAYVDMIKWEDTLRSHPMFTRVALSAIDIYVRLFDNPKLASIDGTEGESASQKKANKKAKKDREAREKAEAEKREADRKSGKKATGADGEVKKEDPDPEGKQLLETKTPLEDAMKFLTPLLEFTPESLPGQHLGFEVFLRRKKYLLALKCLLAAAAVNPSDAIVHEQSVRFRHTLNNLSEPLPPQVTQVIDSSFTILPADTNLTTHNDAFLSKHAQSPPHVRNGLRARQLLASNSQAAQSKNEKDLIESVKLDAARPDDVTKAMALLREWRSDQKTRDGLLEEAHKKWPQVTAFSKD